MTIRRSHIGIGMTLSAFLVGSLACVAVLQGTPAFAEDAKPLVDMAVYGNYYHTGCPDRRADVKTFVGQCPVSGAGEWGQGQFVVQFDPVQGVIPGLIPATLEITFDRGLANSPGDWEATGDAVSGPARVEMRCTNQSLPYTCEQHIIVPLQFGARLGQNGSPIGTAKFRAGVIMRNVRANRPGGAIRAVLTLDPGVEDINTGNNAVSLFVGPIDNSSENFIRHQVTRFANGKYRDTIHFASPGRTVANLVINLPECLSATEAFLSPRFVNGQGDTRPDRCTVLNDGQVSCTGLELFDNGSHRGGDNRNWGEGFLTLNFTESDAPGCYAPAGQPVQVVATFLDDGFILSSGPIPDRTAAGSTVQSSAAFSKALVSSASLTSASSKSSASQSKEVKKLQNAVKKADKKIKRADEQIARIQKKIDKKKVKLAAATSDERRQDINEDIAEYQQDIDDVTAEKVMLNQERAQLQAQLAVQPQ